MTDVNKTTTFGSKYVEDADNESACYGDGLDWMGGRNEKGWLTLSCWGEDGWDLGEWPYVIFMLRLTDSTAEVCVYCEGDLTTTTYSGGHRETRLRAAFADIDVSAKWYWDRQVAGPPDDEPNRGRGPYSNKMREAAGYPLVHAS